MGSARGHDRTSALLILASSVDPNLASTCDRVVLSTTIRSLMITPSDTARAVRRAGGLVSSHAIGP
jgi:hypothetical protein